MMAASRVEVALDRTLAFPSIAGMAQARPSIARRAQTPAAIANTEGARA